MTNDETEQGTKSPLGTPAETETSADETASEDQNQQQPQQKRFYFYDAKAVGSIVVGSSASSLASPKDEKPNPNRFNFYDPAVKSTVDENVPNTQFTVQGKVQAEDQRQDSKVEKLSNDKAPIRPENGDATQPSIEHATREENVSVIGKQAHAGTSSSVYAA